MLEEFIAEFGAGEERARISPERHDWILEVDREYFVYVDGIRYKCLATTQKNLWGYTTLGNPSIKDALSEDNGMPFLIMNAWDSDGAIFWMDFYRAEAGEACNHTIAITTIKEVSHPIDAKYLPCDLMFEVTFGDTIATKYAPESMSKPIIISGSVDAVLEKLKNGEIPIVKVRYISPYSEYDAGSAKYGYAAEFTCDTYLYGTHSIFSHLFPYPSCKLTVEINISTDDPSDIAMSLWSYDTPTSPMVIS